METKHRSRLLDDGWTRLECLSCGQVKFRKPFDLIREQARAEVGAIS